MSDEIHSVGSIEEGITTKEQVLSRVGQPHDKWDDPCGEVFWYEGDYSDGIFGFSEPYGRSYSTFLNEEEWWFSVYFSNAKIVSFIIIRSDNTNLTRRWIKRIPRRLDKCDKQEFVDNIREVTLEKPFGSGGLRSTFQMLKYPDEIPDN